MTVRRIETGLHCPLERFKTQRQFCLMAASTYQFGGPTRYGIAQKVVLNPRDSNWTQRCLASAQTAYLQNPTTPLYSWCAWTSGFPTGSAGDRAILLQRQKDSEVRSPPRPSLRSWLQSQRQGKEPAGRWRGGGASHPVPIKTTDLTDDTNPKSEGPRFPKRRPTTHLRAKPRVKLSPKLAELARVFSP